jgi:hypothetical protein
MKKLLLPALVFCVYAVFAQNANNNISKLRIGFDLGMNYSLLHSNDPLFDGAEIYNGVGAKLGVLMDYSLTPKLFFSPKAEFAFNKCGVDFTGIESSDLNYKVYKTSADLMAHMVYKPGQGKSALYFLAGPALRLPLKFSSKSETTFTTKPDFAIDFGIGLQNRLKYFLFAPEIRYSLGLLNINKHPALESLYYHSISLMFSFK